MNRKSIIEMELIFPNYFIFVFLLIEKKNVYNYFYAFAKKKTIKQISAKKIHNALRCNY